VLASNTQFLRHLSSLNRCWYYAIFKISLSLYANSVPMYVGGDPRSHYHGSTLLVLPSQAEPASNPVSAPPGSLQQRVAKAPIEPTALLQEQFSGWDQLL